MRRVPRRNSASERDNDQITLADAFNAFRRYAVASAEVKVQKSLADSFRDVLHAFAEAHGTENANGHREYDFGQEISLPGGKTGSRIVREKRVTETVNLERVRALGDEKGLTSRLFRKVVVEEFSEDELYAAYQEDLITEEELRSVIDTETTYALRVR